MTSTAIVTEDTALVADDRRFDWGVVIAGAVAAVAVTFFLVTLGSGVGLALVSPTRHGVTAFFTLGAIWFFAAQAFGFVVGGYLVGRLIGPEIETDKEEEFRAAAHGLVMWAIAVVAGLLAAGFSAGLFGSALAVKPSDNPAAVNSYYMDMLFRPAANTAVVAADKAEAARILAAGAARQNGLDDGDLARLEHLVGADAGISPEAAYARINDVRNRMRQDADAARKAASYATLWAAFALLFGAVVAMAAAISARWMDDRISFSLAPRARA